MIFLRPNSTSIFTKPALSEFTVTINNMIYYTRFRLQKKNVQLLLEVADCKSIIVNIQYYFTIAKQ